MINLTGCGTALVTPFHADGSVDEPTLRELVEWQIASGTRFLVACGTTGETPTLNEDEWLGVIRVVCETAAGRIPVLAGCTHNSTSEAVDHARQAARVPGVAGLLSANPYYNKPTQEGQYQHFKAIANAVELPVVVYNIPGRTGANLEPATLLRLAQDAPNIAGVKESTGIMQQITDTIHLMPAGFPVLCGDDPIALAVIAVGGAGLVSVASNEIPAEMARMIDAALSSDWDIARSLNRRYYRLMTANFLESNPGPVKCVMGMMGRLEPHYRLPMVPVASATRSRLEALAKELGLLNSAAQRQNESVPSRSSPTASR